MQQPEAPPEGDGARPSAARAVAMTVVLLGIVVWLVVSSARESHSPESRREGKATRTYLEALYISKMVYVANQIMPADELKRGLASERHRALRQLDEVATATHRPGPVRKLAIMQAVTRTGDWQKTLQRLRLCVPPLPAREVAEELAVWKHVLGTAPVPRPEAGRLEQRLRAMSLGWFQTPALVSLYRKAGMDNQASELLLRSAGALGLLALMFLAGFGLGLLGLVLGLVLVITYVRTRRLPAFLPRALQAVPLRLPTTRQADLLYGVFALYIGSFLVLRLLRDHMAGRAASRAAESSMLANGLVSLAIMALMFAIPFVVFLIAGRRAGLRPADIGLRLRPVWAEVAWGILGYIVIMPAVILVTIAASRIPGAEDSAIHPIVYELGAPGSSAVLALLFILAAVFAPLTEETMFRGVFFNALAPRLGVAWSIVVSSLVFSILHPQLPVGGPAIYLLGVGFSALYAIRGSLVAPMVAHAINNGATLLMLTLVFAG